MAVRLYVHKHKPVTTLTDEQFRERAQQKYGPALRMSDQGFTHKEIAQVLGLKKNYIQSLVAAGRWYRERGKL